MQIFEQLDGKLSYLAEAILELFSPHQNSCLDLGVPPNSVRISSNCSSPAPPAPLLFQATLFLTEQYWRTSLLEEFGR